MIIQKILNNLYYFNEKIKKLKNCYLNTVDESTYKGKEKNKQNIEPKHKKSGLKFLLK